ncbi:MAG: antitoxin [Candidatus Dormibacteria bacterium]
MSRTTLDLDPSVLSDLRKRGRQEKKSMGRLASELLARGLAGRDTLDRPPHPKWVSRDLGRPLVDLEDKQAVWDLLERGD